MAGARAMWKSSGRPVVLIALLVATLLGWMGLAYNWTCSAVKRHNDEYLSAAIADTAHLMISIGAAKAFADVIEGSTVDLEGRLVVGAGTRIEVGDVLQPVLDYLDVAWKILIINLVYLLIAKYVLLGSTPVWTGLLAVSLVGYLVSEVSRRFTAPNHAVVIAARKLGGMCLLGALLFSIILPLTVNLSSRLAHATTDPLRTSVRARFQELDRIFSLKEFHNAEGIVDKAKALKNKMASVTEWAPRAVANVAGSVAELAAAKVLDGIVFPLGSLLFLVWIVRGILFPALGLSASSMYAHDVEALRAWASSETRAGNRQQGPY